MLQIQKYLSFLLGVIYVLSGVGKVLDIKTFSDLIESYGNSRLSIMAPLIATIELGLGLGLILRFKVSRLSKFSFFFLILLSSIYCYGYFIKNIEDCGCFGIFFKVKPYISFLRNMVIIAVSLFLWRNSNLDYHVPKPYILTVGIICVITLITSSYNLRLMNKSQKHFLIHTDIRKTFMGKYIVNENSVIFIFSPRCEHCLVQAKLLPKKSNNIVGLYSNSLKDKDLLDFKKEAKVNFKTYAVENDSINKYISTYPLFFYVGKNIVSKVSRDYLD